jgi:hypothetical protein
MGVEESGTMASQAYLTKHADEIRQMTKALRDESKISLEKLYELTDDQRQKRNVMLAAMMNVHRSNAIRSKNDDGSLKQVISLFEGLRKAMPSQQNLFDSTVYKHHHVHIEDGISSDDDDIAAMIDATVANFPANEFTVWTVDQQIHAHTRQQQQKNSSSKNEKKKQSKSN